eukprot:CAMPEP_0173383662 /NCGR_PEP_ID=MMETSP1356-20130122/6231_1 /TAXON_ID=77927 ORGANISM="Hemiselmis virescens, Strain PCC157" /NCGR_SAMPLE_ID=MMETSP1356 /ASSEMBLY_ACC=CAM_ASM_000847 /LENGTH=88 /DNA_ID=CAMNT_0014338637 /DNA_START=454 /DNA_END=717 /DNA_ORIENTATION=-
MPPGYAVDLGEAVRVPIRLGLMDAGGCGAPWAHDPHCTTVLPSAGRLVLGGSLWGVRRLRSAPADYAGGVLRRVRRLRGASLREAHCG